MQTPGLVAPSCWVHRIHPDMNCPVVHDKGLPQGAHVLDWPMGFCRYVPRAQVQLSIEELPAGDQGNEEGQGTGGSKDPEEAGQ